MKKNGKMRFFRNGFIALALLATGMPFLLVALLPGIGFSPYLLAVVAVGVLALLVSLYFLIAYRIAATDPAEVDAAISEKLSDASYRVSLPAALCKKNGRIVWCNEAFHRASGARHVMVGDSIEKVSGLRASDLAEAAEDIEEKETVLGDRLYTVEVYAVQSSDETEYFVMFRDFTELMSLRRTLHNERTVVAYIMVDNLEEILQFVQERFSTCEAEVEGKLKDWVVSMNGIFRSYDRNKYMAIFDVVHLEALIGNRFSILDDIRSVHAGDGMSITISMGVSDIAGSLSDRAAAAESALDLALQRGGDQAVYRSDDDTQFYGGKTKAIYKRTNVRARTVASEIAALIGHADNVLIMGHRFADFDSFASSVGMARFCMHCGARFNIVVNFSDTNIKGCIERMMALPEYKNVFVDGPTAMDKIRPDTLLIVVDVNNFDHVEYPAIVRNVQTVAVIDHHRKTADFTVKPAITYIETSASSASELVSEMLEQSISSKSLLKDEAEMLMSGILLDTQQFTRNTGMRTFGIALYLRGEGANPQETSEFFKSDMEEVVKEAKFHTNVHTYRDVLAIAVCTDDADPSYRVAAAKAADKLLKVKGIEASFSLVKIDDKVHISARSAGKINVQLILEKLHGGGHFDVAGAQVTAESSHEVVALLKAAIDDYFDKQQDGDKSAEGGE